MPRGVLSSGAAAGPGGGAVRGLGAGGRVVVRVIVGGGGSGGEGDLGSCVPSFLGLESVGDGFYLLIGVFPGGVECVNLSRLLVVSMLVAGWVMLARASRHVSCARVEGGASAREP